MISPEFFIKIIQENRINFFAGVPDSLLKDVCAFITDNVANDKNIITANEGCAVAVGAGHYLATGEVPLIYMQNSGLGNAINPLLSLADEKVYSIPMLLMIGWRGEPNIYDEPQHIKQGEVTLSLLDTMGMPYIILSDDEVTAKKMVDKVVKDCKKTSKPHAIIIKKGTFSPYNLQKKFVNTYSLSREAALKCIIDLIPSNSIIISTTGKLSRELYEYRDELKQSHESDFLTVGSMGHSSSIALGISMSVPNRRVFCFDGDGAFLMHMGAMTNIGYQSPKNYVHIIFNNGAHESVGGQPTVAFNLDIPSIARACGYRKVYSINRVEEINLILPEILKCWELTLIEIKVGIKSRTNLGRPTSTPIQNKEDFMRYIQY